jgi:hypothetical protein
MYLLDQPILSLPDLSTLAVALSKQSPAGGDATWSGQGTKRTSPWWIAEGG